MSKNKSDHVFEQMLCPICFEIPEDEVYLCRNGHAICKTCCANLRECPECRISFDEGKVRNRVLESLLDSLDLDCPHKDTGCKEKMKRGQMKNHSRICTFNPKNQVIKQRYSICKDVGFTNCDYLIETTANMQNVREHFVRRHGAVERSGYGVSVQMGNFECALTSQDSMWSPILLSLNSDNLQNQDGHEPTFLICALLNADDKSVSWICLLIGGYEYDGSESGQKVNEMGFEVDFRLKNEMSELKELKWKTPVVFPHQCKTFLKSRPIRFPVALLKQQFINPDGILWFQAALNVTTVSVEEQLRFTNLDSDPTWIFNMTLMESSAMGQSSPSSFTPSFRGDHDPYQELRRTSTSSEFSVVQGGSSSRMQRATSYSSIIQNSQLPPTLIFDGIKCNNCCNTPITNVRFKCLQCVNYDLCVSCMRKNVHAEHVFAMMDDLERNAKVTRVAAHLGTKRGIIPFAVLKNVPWQIRNMELQCCTDVHTGMTKPKACYTCLECPEEQAPYFCDKCIQMRKVHKNHVLALTNTEQRREFILYQFHKGFIPLKSFKY